MAERYVRIGQYPDYRDEVRGTLAEILASTANPGTYAAPEDVAGCTLEMGADGKWVGTLGSLSKATADALYASGALANLATGATYRDTSGQQVTWGGAGVGWVTLSCAMTTKQTIVDGAVFNYGDQLSGISYVQQSSVDSDFIGMKLIFRNNSLNPITITNAKIASTAVDLDTGSALSWVQITVAGSTSFTIPACTMNGTSSTLGEIISDFCSVTSSAAVNGKRIFQVRVYHAGPASLGGTPGIAPVIRSNYGVLAATNATGGDKVTSPAVAFAPEITGSNSGWNIFSGVILYGAGAAVPAVLNTGDSIANGVGATFHVGNPLFIVRKTSARAFSVANYATPGQNTSDSLAIAEANISKGYSAIATGMYSPNDWGSPNFPLNFAKMCDVIDKILASGAIAIVYTPAPYSGAEASQDIADRLYWTQKCLALAGSRVRVFDRNASVGDPANPGKYLPAYTDGGAHPNDAGYAKLATDFAGIILSAL